METLVPRIHDTAESSDIRERSYHVFLDGLAKPTTAFPWWSAVVITAGSKAQAEIYRQQIHRRSERGYLPRNVSWHVVSDPEGRHIGSGGATLGALQAIGKSDPAWWNRNRVLVIHAGGESRRLPEYSLTGKLFGVLPARTPWGENSTVFDETVALSTLWLERFSSGLAVSSGDVVLTFDAAGLEWDRPGVAGTAIRQPMEVGMRHGIYVLDERGRVYSFLQKPTPAQVRAAGGILPGGVSSHDRVALDTGLLHFDAELSASLSHLASTLARDSVPRPLSAVHALAHRGSAMRVARVGRPAARGPVPLLAGGRHVHARRHDFPFPPPVPGRSRGQHPGAGKRTWPRCAGDRMPLGAADPRGRGRHRRMV